MEFIEGLDGGDGHSEVKGWWKVKSRDVRAGLDERSLREIERTLYTADC